MPKKSSKCITKEYLFNILRKNLFYVPTFDLSHAYIKRPDVKLEDVFNAV